ncbi:MAG: threonine synthase [Chloroflexi bacterium]|nr:threonine synthase [Chloroflexota bacterium]MBI5828134.1 threonine synthase [Chloroflexota bacterium]
MTNFLGYECSLCGQKYGPNEVEYVCPKHGDMGNLDVVLDYAAITRAASPGSIAASPDLSVWRYAPLLPVADPGFGGTPLHSAGWTPLYRADRLAAALGLKTLFVKDDGRNPTASFKDRASAIVVARARELGAAVIAAASTGNAGAALAGMGAAVGQPVVIFAPETAPQAKIAQLLMFGARVLLVKGNYDQAFDLTLQASPEFGWYCRNTGYNPFTVEGKKTAAFEMCEQLSQISNSKLQTPNLQSAIRNPQWTAPDRVFVSVGDGNIISGIHKGFKDLLALGWIDKMPKLMGVQAAGSAACANAWAAHTETITPVAADTLADSISVDLPRDGVRAVRAVRETGGEYVVVTDDEILAAMRDLARGAAVFAEPAGSTAYAGLMRAVHNGAVGADETIVVINTGNGLKDVKSAMKAAGEATVIEPTLEAVKAVLN